MIIWTILGSGTHISSATRNSPGHLADVGETRLLVDCGPGSFHGIRRAGYSPYDIDVCLITHLHPDHTADLLPFQFAIRNHVKESGGEKTIHLIGPHGFRQYVQGLADLHTPFLNTEGLVWEIREVELEEIHFPGLTVGCAPVAHRMPALAYSLESTDGARAVYSGDTGPSNELVRLACGADLLLIETGCSNGNEVPHHLTPAEAAALASEAGAGKMVMVHINPGYDKTEWIGQCGDRFDGEVVAGEDGMVLRVLRGGAS